MKLFKYKLCILLFSLALITQLYTIASYASIQIKKNKITHNIENYACITNTAILTSEEQETLNLINEYRNKNGLSNLIPVNNLQNVALLKATDLQNNNYFSHTSPIYGNPYELLNSQNISYNYVGENLAGNIDSRHAVDAWINSESHRNNILDTQYKYTGICIINSDKYGKIFVQIFLG